MIIDFTLYGPDYGHIKVVGSGVYREFDVKPGILFVVLPVNPRTKKHRGRICKFLRWRYRDGYPFDAWVQFQDTKRPGAVDPGDLQLL